MLRSRIWVAALLLVGWAGCPSEAGSEPAADAGLDAATEDHQALADQPAAELPPEDTPLPTPDVGQDAGADLGEPDATADGGEGDCPAGADDVGSPLPTELMLGNGLQTCESVLLKPDPGEEGSFFLRSSLGRVNCTNDTVSLARAGVPSA